MAKKTNKTDHVLNLLSSGKKTSAKEENDAPPVDLRRRAPEQPEEDTLPGEENLPEPRMTESDDRELPVPETKVTVEMAPKAPGVSVVHAANDENHIADAVKDSLEAEFNEYLREKGEIPAEPETERLIEWEMPKAKEPTEINVFKLMRESEEEDAVQEEQAEVSMETVVEPAQPAAEPKMEQELTEPKPEPAEPELVMESEPEPEPEPEPAGPESESEETVPAEKPAQEEAAAPAAPEEEPMEEKDYTMVNVMEYLVRDQAPRYIRQFGHCDCDRCIEDTVALTLTHLPAKYVVVNKNAVSPLLNFYEKRYAGQLIVEITKATMIVNGSPNH